MDISIKDNLAAFTKELDAVAKTQVPYATALALNDLARRVIAGEVAEISRDFPTLTPFTRQAFGYIPAKKDTPFAVVFIKDIQAHYLGAYIDGGQSVPTPGGAMVVPVNIAKNQYGNIPYKKTQQMLAKKNVFYASRNDTRFHGVKPFSGIFERIQTGTGPRGGIKTSLVTLVIMKDPWSLKQHFDFYERANDVVQSNFNDAMEQAMLRALGSMR